MLNTWDPVRLLDRMVDDVVNGSYGAATNPKGFNPAVDVRSSEERIVFSFDMPGLRAGDIDVTLEEGVLTVKGARKFEGSGPKEQILLGRSYGAFARSFKLVEPVDEERLSAKLADGVLTVEIPKVQKAKPRRVPIQQGGPAAPEGNGASKGQ